MGRAHHNNDESDLKANYYLNPFIQAFINEDLNYWSIQSKIWSRELVELVEKRLPMV